MDSELTFRLMGGLAVARTGAAEAAIELGGPRPRRLLAALLLSLDQPLPPDRLIELVWGDEPPASARNSLQAYVSNLRRALAPIGHRTGAEPPIARRSGGYVLLADRSQLDIGRFQDEVAAGTRASAEGRGRDAVRSLGAALGAWAPLLPELADVPFVRAEAVRLDARRATAFEVLQTERIAIGEHHDAMADLRRALAIDPRAERLWALLARARAAAGHPADAIATISDARAALADIGLGIGSELRRLEVDLFAQEPALDSLTSAEAQGTPPLDTGRPESEPRLRSRRCHRSSRSARLPAARHHRC